MSAAAKKRPGVKKPSHMDLCEMFCDLASRVADLEGDEAKLVSDLTRATGELVLRFFATSEAPYRRERIEAVIAALNAFTSTLQWSPNQKWWLAAGVRLEMAAAERTRMLGAPTANA